MAFDQSQYDLTANPLQQGGSYNEAQIGDAQKRMKALQGALQSGQIDYSTYQNLFNQFDPAAKQTVSSILQSGNKAAGAGNAQGGTDFLNESALGGTDLNTYANQFKNLTGKDPTGQDITGFFSNMGSQMKDGTNFADVNSLVNQYISNSAQPQIQQYQTGQMTDALSKAQQQSQDLVKQQNQASVDQLTSPDSMAKIEQGYNQQGLLNSGAFSQGLGNTLANAASSNESNALAGVTIPGINNIQNTTNAPYQNYLSGLSGGTQQAGQNQQNTTNFGMQSQLAQQLQSMMSPSTLQQWAPIIQGAEQGGGAATSKSAICLELLRRGLTSWDEVDELHWKVVSSMFTRCRALLFYSQNGDKLVKAANAQGFDWNEAKEWFIDEPLSQTSSIKAVISYSLACKKLALIVAPELWDERVMKGSFLDFFRFIIPVMKVPGYRRCYKDLFKRTFFGLREVYNG